MKPRMIVPIFFSNVIHNISNHHWMTNDFFDFCGWSLISTTQTIGKITVFILCFDLYTASRS
nr:MAG TPA: hypothetical protein [Bacteriophage sp.]